MQRKVTADFYFKEARRLGFVARSAFKLQEIQVATVALGAAGGSVLGVDLKDTVVPALYCDHRVKAIQGDVTCLAPADLLAICPPGFHTVLSDMAPNTAGAGRLDAIRSLTLAHAALGLAVGEDGVDENGGGGGGDGGVLLPGGHFVVKLLEGAGTREWGKECGAHFRKVLWVRPKSTRAESKEVYLVGLHRKP